MIRIEDIIEKVEQNRPGADLDVIRRAYLFSALHHRGQTRASGEPYLVHPLEVANILADMRLDETSVSTGLLHDVVEDTLVDLDTIKSYFGDTISQLVDGLTKIATISEPKNTVPKIARTMSTRIPSPDFMPAAGDTARDSRRSSAPP